MLFSMHVLMPHACVFLAALRRHHAHGASVHLGLLLIDIQEHTLAIRRATFYRVLLQRMACTRLAPDLGLRPESAAQQKARSVSPLTVLPRWTGL